MADTKISALPSGVLAAAAVLAGVAGGVTSQFSVGDIPAFVATNQDDGTFAYVDGTEDLDTAVHGNYRQTNDLDGNTTLTLTNGTNGRGGNIYVRQDGTGGRTVTIACTGATAKVDGSPNLAADAISRLEYGFATIDGVLHCKGDWHPEGGSIFSAASRLFGSSSTAGSQPGAEISLGTSLAVTGTTLDVAASGVTSAMVTADTLVLADIADAAVHSGIYQPTLTTVANIDATVTHNAFYVRVGSVVYVTGTMEIDPTTASGTSTQLGISLPIASNFVSTTEDGGGFGREGSGNAQIGNLVPDTTNDRVQLTFLCAATTNQTWRYHFAYQVL